MSARGADPAHVEKNELYQVAHDFWNIRVSFKMFSGFVDIGSHMSLIRLLNGNFLIIDAVTLTDETRASIDRLTDNGNRIEAVIGVHPFHTLAFPSFHQIYPKAEYYGTPRHLRRLPNIPWTGSLDNCHVRRKWVPEVEMRIPAGAEFISPTPESSNHFASVFVFHRPSRTLHVDDTIIYGDNPNFLLKLIGFKHGSMAFHPAIKSSGLYPTLEAPLEFRNWMKMMLKDWPFDNLCCAHSGVRKGGAHEQVSELVNNAESLFQKLSEKNGKRRVDFDHFHPSPSQTNLNITGDECG